MQFPEAVGSKTLIFVLVFCLFGVSSQGAILCTDVFFEARFGFPLHIRQSYSDMFPKGKWAHHKTNVYVSPDGSAKLSARVFFDRGYRIEMIQGERMWGGDYKSFPPPRARELKEDWVNEFVHDLFQFIKREYPRRDWTPEFIDTVLLNLKDYLYDSTIVVIRHPQSNEIVASIRAISAPYLMVKESGAAPVVRALDGSLNIPRLPVEKVFGELPREQLTPWMETPCRGSCQTSLQSLFEISTLAVKKQGRRAEVAGLLFKYFLFSSMTPVLSIAEKPISFFPYSNARDSIHFPGSLFSLMVQNPSSSFIHAYGDRAGLLMYRPYDFQPHPETTSREIMGETWNVINGHDGMFAGVRGRYEYDRFAIEALSFYESFVASAIRDYPPYYKQNYDSPDPRFVDYSVYISRIHDVLGGDSLDLGQIRVLSRANLKRVSPVWDHLTARKKRSFERIRQERNDRDRALMTELLDLGRQLVTLKNWDPQGPPPTPSEKAYIRGLEDRKEAIYAELRRRAELDAKEDRQRDEEAGKRIFRYSR